MVTARVKRRVPAATDSERERFYEPVARVFRRLLGEEGKRARDAYRDGEPIEEAVNRGRLRRALVSLYERVTGYFGRRTRADIDGGEFDAEPLREWAEDTASERVQYLNETSVQEVTRLIQRGERREASREEIARDIEMLYRQRAPRRAEAIALTEVSAAANAAALEAARHSGAVKNKVWQSMDDDRVRTTHVAADGQTVGIDEDFIVGGAPGDHPCDPKLPGHETINCRCELRLLI